MVRCVEACFDFPHAETGQLAFVAGDVIVESISIAEMFERIGFSFRRWVPEGGVQREPLDLEDFNHATSDWGIQGGSDQDLRRLLRWPAPNDGDPDRVSFSVASLAAGLVSTPWKMRAAAFAVREAMGPAQVATHLSELAAFGKRIVLQSSASEEARRKTLAAHRRRASALETFHMQQLELLQAQLDTERTERAFRERVQVRHLP